MPHQRVGDVDLFHELVDYCEPWRHDCTPVVFIHGLGGSHAMWLYQVPAFCTRFPVINVDLRNHGASTKIDAEFTIADMATDIARLLRVLGVSTAHVVGLSLGGMVALQLAVDHPSAVSGLVLADTLAGALPGMEHVGREALAFIENNSMAEVARARITTAFSPGVNSDARDHFIEQVSRNDKDAYVRAARAAFAFNLRDRLRDVKKQTLVVVGEEDVTTPPVLSEELAAGIPGARLVRLAGAGHISNVERPREFNAAVLEFCAAVRA
jgi:3-oxoadipate enol-lactonase